MGGTSDEAEPLFRIPYTIMVGGQASVILGEKCKYEPFDLPSTRVPISAPPYFWPPDMASLVTPGAPQVCV